MTAAAGVVGTGTPESCTEAALDEALTDGGAVTFDCGGAVTLAITRTKIIAVDTTIDGGDLTTISGGNAVRIFEVDLDASLSLDRLIIADGFSVLEPGGGIRNFGTLLINNCTLSRNTSESFGGGVDNEGTCTISDSTFSDNDGGSGGGGIANFRTLAVRRSTFFRNVSGIIHLLGRDNDPGSGGGILNLDTVIISNTTFSSNTAVSNNNPDHPVPAFGGGLYNEGSATVINCTFSRNGAPIDGYCGGIHSSGKLTVKNTVIANGIGASCCDDADGVADESTHNLVDDQYNTCGDSFVQVNRAALQLRGLADNGGPTFTAALAPGSVASGAGDPKACMDTTTTSGVDQRGHSRFGPGDSTCDIGAFEAPFSPTPAPTPPTFLSFNGEPSISFGGNLHVTLTPLDGTFSADHTFGYVQIMFLRTVPEYPTFWYLDFLAPAGAELMPSDYLDVAGFGYQGLDQPALGISDGGGCSLITGTFSVREAAYSIDGGVDRFAADFEQHCYGEKPALFGSIRLNSSVPTASPPRVRTPTPTPRRTGALPTPTPTPTATIQANQPCFGDCNRDGKVSVDELVAGVAFALGHPSSVGCDAIDSNSDGRVTVDELVLAVNVALNGCRSLPLP
ncbi:MAG TPA: choice-of-anchor Q domain-containing protein [Candidatus Binatia bacterium]|nr:choice-of-anchor Q domain-containing protein [Candidatus Binatia bacterium]